MWAGISSAIGCHCSASGHLHEAKTFEDKLLLDLFFSFESQQPAQTSVLSFNSQQVDFLSLAFMQIFSLFLFFVINTMNVSQDKRSCVITLIFKQYHSN